MLVNWIIIVLLMCSSSLPWLVYRQIYYINEGFEKVPYVW